MAGVLANGDDPAASHLRALVAEWHVLADLSFSDLLLLVRDGAGFTVAAQLRPSTGPTIYTDDLVGAPVTRVLADRAWADGRIHRDGDPEWETGVPVRHEAIPVVVEGRVVAVVSRDANLAAARVPSRLELTYLRIADDLARAVAAGAFPAGDPPPDSPRVGDGVVRLGVDGEVEYASPNAVSAYRRLGAEPHGHLRPGIEDVEAGGAVLRRRTIPLPDGGALVLVRDVTDLRRRERQLLSKDATIREIHHRVKNNLQTVAALLRLQSRRTGSPEAREALEESVRRVSAIALVHETLSHVGDEAVPFDEVVDQVVRLVTEMAPTAVSARRAGTAGGVPAEVATPLSLVLAELLQNAVEHAAPSYVEVSLARGPGGLRVTVTDDGRGLPEGYEDRLGLQIVRTLVESELRGTLALAAGESGGTAATLSVPLAPPSS